MSFLEACGRGWTIQNPSEILKALCRQRYEHRPNQSILAKTEIQMDSPPHNSFAKIFKTAKKLQ